MPRATASGSATTARTRFCRAIASWRRPVRGQHDDVPGCDLQLEGVAALEYSRRGRNLDLHFRASIDTDHVLDRGAAKRAEHHGDRHAVRNFRILFCREAE